ncbi:hypothetical protein [Leptospira dzoumogneensis]|uniref:Uncharacterized protein n=1 Tax=Leptospira dzoumogneensis TaxID=2484904 RepID=A0A4Z1AAT8_9LEPT|nr:hypothetical protein [Leptospira dzoumogneensis]TGM97315.1 hypothetical protein EHR06_14290 [Leptospira dzoumogneensis]
MDIFREIYEEAKKRVGSPIVGTISLTILFWNFDPIYRLAYLSAQGLIVTHVDLEIFNNEFSLWRPIILGLLLVPFRRGLELLGSFSFVFLESIYNRWLQRAEAPNFSKNIQNLKKIETKLKSDLQRMKEFGNGIFKILTKENLNRFAQILIKVEDFTIANVNETAGVGDILAYNIKTAEFQKMERIHEQFNGILAYRLTNKTGIIVFSGILPSDILPINHNGKIESGFYIYDFQKYRFIHTTQSGLNVIGEVIEGSSEFKIINNFKIDNSKNPFSEAGF